MNIQRARTDAEIEACHGVLSQLRSSLSKDTFVADVRRMELAGFQIAYLADPDVRAVAGYRLQEMFATGVILYVNDLVTAAEHRSKGYGKELLAWLLAEATASGCKYLELDSGTARLDAHRFYRRNGMEEVALHFSMPTGGGPRWTPGS